MCFTSDSSFGRDDPGSAFAAVRTMHACAADEQTRRVVRSATMQLDEKEMKETDANIA
jgi:hypothetical protein